MNTFKNAYVFLPDRLVSRFTEKEQRSAVFIYEGEKEPVWKKISKKVRMFIWGGRNFLADIEEDLYTHVRLLG